MPTRWWQHDDRTGGGPSARGAVAYDNGSSFRQTSSQLYQSQQRQTQLHADADPYKPEGPAPGFNKTTNTAAPKAALPKVWEYEDPLKDVHGPFDASQIINWFAQDWFGTDLKIRRVGQYWTQLEYVLEELKAEARGNAVPAHGGYASAPQQLAGAAAAAQAASYGARGASGNVAAAVAASSGYGKAAAAEAWDAGHVADPNDGWAAGGSAEPDYAAISSYHATAGSKRGGAGAHNAGDHSAAGGVASNWEGGHVKGRGALEHSLGRRRYEDEYSTGGGYSRAGSSSNREGASVRGLGAADYGSAGRGGYSDEHSAGGGHGKGEYDSGGWEGGNARGRGGSDKAYMAVQLGSDGKWERGYVITGDNSRRGGGRPGSRSDRSAGVYGDYDSYGDEYGGSSRGRGKSREYGGDAGYDRASRILEGEDDDEYGSRRRGRGPRDGRGGTASAGAAVAAWGSPGRSNGSSGRERRVRGGDRSSDAYAGDATAGHAAKHAGAAYGAANAARDYASPATAPADDGWSNSTSAANGWGAIDGESAAARTTRWGDTPAVADDEFSAPKNKEHGGAAANAVAEEGYTAVQQHAGAGRVNLGYDGWGDSFTNAEAAAVDTKGWGIGCIATPARVTETAADGNQQDSAADKGESTATATAAADRQAEAAAVNEETVPLLAAQADSADSSAELVVPAATGAASDKGEEAEVGISAGESAAAGIPATAASAGDAPLIDLQEEQQPQQQLGQPEKQESLLDMQTKQQANLLDKQPAAEQQQQQPENRQQGKATEPEKPAEQLIGVKALITKREAELQQQAAVGARPLSPAERVVVPAAAAADIAEQGNAADAVAEPVAAEETAKAEMAPLLEMAKPGEEATSAATKDNKTPAAAAAPAEAVTPAATDDSNPERYPVCSG